jgi:hypothetical protein
MTASVHRADDGVTLAVEGHLGGLVTESLAVVD